MCQQRGRPSRIFLFIIQPTIDRDYKTAELACRVVAVRAFTFSRIGRTVNPKCCDRTQMCTLSHPRR